MAEVTRKWIDENVKLMTCFGGQINLENYKEYVKGQKTLTTNLSKKAIKGEIEIKENFLILIPGVGWANCYKKEIRY